MSFCFEDRQFSLLDKVTVMIFKNESVFVIYFCHLICIVDMQCRRRLFVEVDVVSRGLRV